MPTVKIALHGIANSALIITPLKGDGTVDAAKDQLKVIEFDSFTVEKDADDDEIKVLKDTFGNVIITHTEPGIKRGYNVTLGFQTLDPIVLQTLDGGTLVYVTADTPASGVKKFIPRWANLGVDEGKFMLEFYVPNSDGKFAILRMYYVVGTGSTPQFDPADFFKVEFTGSAQVSKDATKPNSPYEFEFGVLAIPVVA